MRHFFFLLTLTATLLAIPAPVQQTHPAPPASPATPVVEELLGELEDGALTDGGWEVSLDGRRLAWRAKRDKKWVMMVNGQPGPAFDEVSHPVFSPDGRRLAYAVESSNKWRMVVDGQAGPEFDHLAERQPVGRSGSGSWVRAKLPLVWFSPNSKHVAYLAKRGKEWFVIADERVSPPYQDVKAPFFSPDGEHIAYPARQAGKWKMVVDGLEQDHSFDEILTPGPIGTAAYRPGGFSPQFSQDGQRISFLGRRKTDWFAVLAGKEIPFGKGSRFFTALPGCVSFSGDLRRYAMVRKDSKTNRFAVELDGRPAGEFDWAACGIFSQDNQHYAFLANRGKLDSPAKGQDQFVIMDGKEGPSFDGIMLLTFSPDHRAVYLAAKVVGEEGKQRMKVMEVADGVMREVTEQGVPQMPVTVVAFSPDGKRTAFLLTDSFYSLGFWSQVWKTRPILASRKGPLRVFVDGKPFGKEYSLSSLYGPNVVPLSAYGVSAPIFSPDSRHLAFVINDHDHEVMKGGAYGVVVTNGQEGKAYSEVLPGSVTFPSDNTVFYVARTGKSFYRVTQILGER